MIDNIDNDRFSKNIYVMLNIIWKTNVSTKDTLNKYIYISNKIE